MEFIDRKRFLINILFKASVILLSLISLVPLLLILFYVFSKGYSSISLEFLTNLPKPVGESGGGIINAMAGTFIICFFSGLIALPPGLLAGIYLAEYPDRKSSSVIRFCAEILQGVPSIVIGILAFIWVVSITGWSGISGAVALSFMMLPVIIKSTEESVKRVPYIIREGALALGTPYYRVMFKVVIPSAFSGILSGFILAFSRIAGETAPLIFTAFGSPYMELNVLKPMSTLPHIIFNYACSGYDDWIRQAWGAAFVLIMILLILNILVKWVNRYGK